MVTPRFSLRQDDEFVVVDMRVPGHVRLGQDDVFMEGRSFLFHAHPYFLRFVLWGSSPIGASIASRTRVVCNETGWSCLETWCRTGGSTPSLTASTTG